MRNKKPIPKYFLPGNIRVHLEDSKGNNCIISNGYGNIGDANDAMLDIMKRNIETPNPFVSGWFSQDIEAVY